MTADEIVEQLKPLGKESYKKVLIEHGVQEPFYGVSIEELKKFQKKIKKDYALSLALYDTGIYDAMYLAGLIADDPKMTKDDLNHWVKKANCYPLSESTVAWVASESLHGRELALEWIESPVPFIAGAGWATLSSLAKIKPDSQLDIAEMEGLLERVRTTIHDRPNRVKYTMNSYIINIGCYMAPLTEKALAAAAEIGTVTVNMGATSCKVPGAGEYIRKVQDRGTIGVKRKTAKC